MADQTKYGKSEVYDFLLTPLAPLTEATSSRGDAREVSSSRAIPSSHGGPIGQREAEPQQAPAPRPDVPAGWYPDPARRHQQRFWDGRAWTCKVADPGALWLDGRPPAA